MSYIEENIERIANALENIATVMLGLNTLNLTIDAPPKKTRKKKEETSATETPPAAEPSPPTLDLGEDTTAAPELTHEDVRVVVKELIAKLGNDKGMKEAVGILISKFKVNKIFLLKPEQIGEAIDFMKAAIK